MKRAIGLHSRVVASPRQISAALADEAVILGLDDGVYYGLDPIGARIWELLQVERDVAEITAHLASEYDVDRERLDRDVLDLLEELLQRRLIEVRDEQDSKRS